MATFRKRGRMFEAAVCRNGIRKSKTFHRLGDAKTWALQTEIKIDKGELGKEDPLFLAVMDRYEREITTHKRSATAEKRRLTAFSRLPLSTYRVGEIDAQKIGEWRDSRMNEVSPGTVLRDWNLLSAIFHQAVKWGYLEKSPMTHVPKPKTPKPRDRRPSQDEIDRLLLVAAYKEPPESIQQRVACAMLFAIETGMRSGEIAGIRPEHDKGKYVHLPVTKTVPRDVPLSKEARRLLSLVKGNFDLTSRQIDANFRRLKGLAGITDLHFHDFRTEALTRMATKVGVLELARISGHKDLKILLNVYYQPDPGDLADLL